MNIKQSIFTLLLLMGVSFSASIYAAGNYGNTKYVVFSTTYTECTGDAGTVHYDLEDMPECFNGKKKPNYPVNFANCRIDYSFDQTTELLCTYYYSGAHTTYAARFHSTTCPDGTQLNQNNGECEEPPPPCSALEGEDAPWPVGQLPNDDKPITAQRLYCDTYKMCEAIAGYTAIGGSIFKESYYTGGKCSDNFSGNDDCQYMGTSCDTPAPPEPELDDPYSGCKKPYPDVPFVCPEDTDGDGIPNPDAPFDDTANCGHDASGKFSCTGGTFDPETPNPNPEPNPDPTVPDDPTNGINDPSPLDPINTTPINPNPTDPEEDVEPVPDSGNGNGDIVTAITNQNSDINKSLHALNEANNKNFAAVNTKLNQLDNNTKAINTNIGLQLKQDIEIYEQNKKLQLQATQETSRLIQQSDTLRGTQIGNQTSALKGAIGGQTTTLKGAIDGQTEAITGALDGLEGAIDKLTDKIPEPCEPTPDNNYCENPHGVDSGLVETVFSQMDDSVDGLISGASSTLLSTAQNTIDNPLTTEAEGIVNDSIAVLMDIIGLNKTCTPLVLGSHNGTNIQISCQVSEQIKMILSFLLGVYTIMTLIDILLDGITPLGSKPSATRYA